MKREQNFFFHFIHHPYIKSFYQKIMKSYSVILYYFCILFLCGIISCSSDHIDSPALEASFSFQPEEVLVGDAVHFINESVGTNEYTEYTWGFGDGNTAKTKNPSNTYTKIGEGIYEVTLTIKNENTESATKEDLTLSLSSILDGRKSLMEKLADGNIITCAHRANHTKSPENSISAINDAITEGIGMIEIDIRETRDGKLVLMHDATINRTTNGSGDVSSYTLHELQEFKLYNKGLLTDEKIPSLKEVLALARGKLYIDLDISKKASFDAIYPVVKQFGMLKQVLFYSSELDVIKRMLNKDSEVVAMPIIDGDSRFEDYLNLGLKIVHYTSSSFNQNFIQKAKEKGWYVFVNSYVNSETTPLDDNYGQIDKVIALGGNIIQTDHPVLVEKYLNK